MTILKTERMQSFLLLFLCIPTSLGFMENFNQRKPLTKNPRPDLIEVVDQQEFRKLNLQLHVGDDYSGFLTVKDMVVELGGRFNEDEEDRMRLPGDDGPYANCASGGRRLDVIEKGSYISMEGVQHVDCQKGCWEMCWVKGRPAGTIVFGFSLPQEYFRNNAILPEGDMWVSFPLWTADGLAYGQGLKRDVLAEIEMYNRMWQEELEKYEMTDNPIMGMIHKQKAHIFATKCDELYDYSLETIPEDDDCHKLEDDLLLSKTGLIWKNNGKNDVLIGQAVVSPVDKGPTLSKFSTGKLRP